VQSSKEMRDAAQRSPCLACSEFILLPLSDILFPCLRPNPPAGIAARGFGAERRILSAVTASAYAGLAFSGRRPPSCSPVRREAQRLSRPYH
jgi:hypothetical protein